MVSSQWFGVSRITAWLTQASERAKSGRYKTVSVTSLKCEIKYKLHLAGREIRILPDGVIGNTWAFGAHVPGSSPGRVAL